MTLIGNWAAYPRLSHPGWTKWTKIGLPGENGLGGGPQRPCRILLEKPSAWPIELERTHVSTEPLFLWGEDLSSTIFLCAPSPQTLAHTPLARSVQSQSKIENQGRQFSFPEQGWILAHSRNREEILPWVTEASDWEKFLKGHTPQNKLYQL